MHNRYCRLAQRLLVCTGRPRASMLKASPLISHTCLVGAQYTRLRPRSTPGWHRHSACSGRSAKSRALNFNYISSEDPMGVAGQLLFGNIEKKVFSHQEPFPPLEYLPVIEAAGDPRLAEHLAHVGRQVGRQLVGWRGRLRAASRQAGRHERI